MLNQAILVLVLALLISAPAQGEIRVEDHVSSFIEAFEKAKPATFDAAKAFILEFEFLTRNELGPTYYDRMSKERLQRTHEFLPDYARNLARLVEQYKKKRPEIIEILQSTDRRFKEIFGHEINAKVFLFSALASTDANARGPAEGPAFSLNLRLLSEYSKEELEIVISHELFHLLQDRLQKGHTRMGSIAGSLFGEGWATYASSLVFPGYPDWKYISYFRSDDGQFKKFQEQKADILKSLLADWESEDPAIYRKYFSGDHKDSGVFEPRSGYYIGYLVAKEMANSRNAKDVALLKPAEFKKQARLLLKNLLQKK